MTVTSRGLPVNPLNDAGWLTATHSHVAFGSGNVNNDTVSDDDTADGDQRSRPSVSDDEFASDSPRRSDSDGSEETSAVAVNDQAKGTGTESTADGGKPTPDGIRDEPASELESAGSGDDDNVFGPLAGSGPIEAETPKLENVVFVMVGIGIGLVAILRLVGFI